MSKARRNSGDPVVRFVVACAVTMTCGCQPTIHHQPIEPKEGFNLERVVYRNSGAITLGDAAKPPNAIEVTIMTIKLQPPSPQDQKQRISLRGKHGSTLSIVGEIEFKTPTVVPAMITIFVQQEAQDARDLNTKRQVVRTLAQGVGVAGSKAKSKAASKSLPFRVNVVLPQLTGTHSVNVQVVHQPTSLVPQMIAHGTIVVE